MSLSFPLAAVVKVPEDILMEILVRLPASSLLRFKCVSKLWSSLISSKYFTNLFFNFSSSRRRRVFVRWNRCLLYSISLCDLVDSTTASFPTLKLDPTFPCIENDLFWLNDALRGLMCFTNKREIQIINFTTRQVLNLPLLESNLFSESDHYYVWNYLGYDPMNDEYKVLNTIFSVTKETYERRSETQVFVLGDGGEASWRNTKSLTFPPPFHDPTFQRGISINGVLYYGAKSHKDRYVLMSFDLCSEEFNLIEFPMEYHIMVVEEFRKIDLINYQDHVAVFDDSGINDTECILNLWVLEEDDTGKKSKWSHKVLVLPYQQIRESIKLEDIDCLKMTGTSLKGEVTLSGRYVNINNKGIYVFYDLENNRITTKGFVIDQPSKSGYRLLRLNIWEDVENIMYLQL